MMETLIFNIIPQPKQRIRVTRRGAYTPKPTVDFEKAIRKMAQEQWKKEPLEGPLICAIVFSHKKPKTGKLNHPPYDLDNEIKSLWDGMQGVVFKDDKQFVGLQAAKVYGEDKIVVSVGKYEPDTPPI